MMPRAAVKHVGGDNGAKPHVWWPAANKHPSCGSMALPDAMSAHVNCQGGCRSKARGATEVYARGAAVGIKYIQRQLDGVPGGEGAAQRQTDLL